MKPVTSSEITAVVAAAAAPTAQVWRDSPSEASEYATAWSGAASVAVDCSVVTSAAFVTPHAVPPGVAATDAATSFDDVVRDELLRVGLRDPGLRVAGRAQAEDQRVGEHADDQRQDRDRQQHLDEGEAVLPGRGREPRHGFLFTIVS